MKYLTAYNTDQEILKAMSDIHLSRMEDIMCKIDKYLRTDDGTENVYNRVWEAVDEWFKGNIQSKDTERSLQSFVEHHEAEVKDLKQENKELRRIAKLEKACIHETRYCYKHSQMIAEGTCDNCEDKQALSKEKEISQ